MPISSNSIRLTEAAQIHVRAIVAVMLRDMRTRFGRTHFSYIIAIGWPLSHLLMIVVAFVTVNRILPFGSDSVVFISTGALPYILCLYPARMMTLMLPQNRALLSFPLVQPIDLIIARSILEILSAFVVVMLFSLGLWVLEIDFMPSDIPTAMLAIYASVFFAVSLGTLMFTIFAILGMPGYIVLILCMIGLYLSSGVTLPIIATSETSRFYLGLNPVFQLVEWLRSAYFETPNAALLNKRYVLELSASLLILGLLGERVFRGKLMR